MAPSKKKRSCQRDGVAAKDETKKLQSANDAHSHVAARQKRLELPSTKTPQRNQAGKARTAKYQVIAETRHSRLEPPNTE